MNFKKLLLYTGVAVTLAACKAQNTTLVEKEVPPAASIDCFPGAYYRKAVTSFDNWSGITGVVVLGQPTVDEDRLDSRTKQPLDNFSVYMGGNSADQELDAGLTWEFSTDASGRKSARRNAWRPFWRAGYWKSAPDSAKYTWHPGDKIQMTIKMAGPKKLRMIIQDMNHPEKRFETNVDASGFTYEAAKQFKRVNAIDQVRNEGKPVQPTKAHVTGAEWLYTTLYRGSKNEEWPMTRARFTDMRCSDATHIRVTATNSSKGAEKIDIFGTPQ
ncbi:hypothetical protein [Mucilaginibacter sp. PAMB04168]|uniref:hypothetical protein n=1 Tax=Mucilaginibacter sp. PAMB04168 TaxID=3138567 RepID=UPI0031F6113C